MRSEEMTSLCEISSSWQRECDRPRASGRPGDVFERLLALRFPGGPIQMQAASGQENRRRVLETALQGLDHRRRVESVDEAMIEG